MAETNTMWVRIRPDKRGLFATKRYMFDGQLFVAERGWYEVTAERADALKELHLDDDPDAPLLFDVVTQEEAEKLDERAKILDERAPASRPHQTIRDTGLSASATGGEVTTADLPPRAGEKKVVDPDPDGEELKAESDEGLAAVGRVPPKEDAPQPRARRR